VDRQPLKPPFAYYGGKTTLAPVIADLLPAHAHYVEPFAGSLAVLLAKRPAPIETVNDLDGDLVTFWRVLRDSPADFARVAALTPHARAEFELAKGLDGTDDLERARRVWVRLTQSRSLSMKPTGWKHVRNFAARGTSHLDYLDAYVARLAPAAERLRSVALESRDALDVIRDYGSESTACLYVDPPYLGSTRATNYRVEMLDDGAHRTFAGLLNDCKASVVLSGYDSPLYADLFGDWHRMNLQGATTLSGDTDRVEVLWSNRPLGEPDLFGGAA
jgi:DNA adenine methylase